MFLLQSGKVVGNICEILHVFLEPGNVLDLGCRAVWCHSNAVRRAVSLRCSSQEGNDVPISSPLISHPSISFFFSLLDGRRAKVFHSQIFEYVFIYQRCFLLWSKMSVMLCYLSKRLHIFSLSDSYAMLVATNRSFTLWGVFSISLKSERHCLCIRVTIFSKP